MSSNNSMLPAGRWRSPIDATAVAGALRFEDLAWSREGDLIWLEHRGARGVLLATTGEGGAPLELTEPQHSVRGRVGYGGGALATGQNFVIFAERRGRLLRQTIRSGLAQAITPSYGFAARPALSPDDALTLFVHHEGSDDCLAIVDANGQQWPQRLVTGSDFYLDPCWSADGRHIAWIEWDHPRMPWDGSRLVLAELQRDSRQVHIRRRVDVAGSETIAVSQPRFAPDGRSLAYLSDQRGATNLFSYDIASDRSECLFETEAELGPPAWVQGARSYDFDRRSAGIYVVENRAGFDRLVRISLSDGARETAVGLEDYTDLRQIAPAPDGSAVALIASGARVSPRVVLWGSGGAGVQIVRRSTGERVAPEALAAAEPVCWSASDGTAVHGLLYRPHRANIASSEDSPPAPSGGSPAIVAVHGGPTAQAKASYNPRAQYFATRGYAYLEVNYRGSSGYGRDYQRALDGQWGVLDVEDALGARAFLETSGLADPRRIAIMGGSAGGYTVLKALVDHPGQFAAGVSLYGVSNLFTLAADTHKFEAHYLDTLVGPLPAAGDLYRERSPIFHADRIRDPLAVFQGSADRVVPPDQAEQIVASLRSRGVPHEYHLYEGEEHGFRRPETVQRFYRDLERFLAQHLIYR
jgi:dipeptidyl aminopeptidase/acylaminoacyl peptidase